MLIQKIKFYVVVSFVAFVVVGCNSTQAATVYNKGQVSFKLPKGWNVTIDRATFGDRYIGVDTSDESLVTIEIFSKQSLLEIEAHKDLNSSLKHYANNVKKRDLTAKLQTPQPITQSTLRRQGREGLKERQRFIVGPEISEVSIREFYRIDTDDQIVFITLDTTEAEYKKSAAGLELILGSFQYQAESSNR